uniref:Uncharacterized protein n=1 Tax=Uronema marinum TaxID=35107 RepID=A0A345WJV9_UROMR|nr:hypothetical protein [Uronema marinum]AXJ93352.1 hypothetical protein [Uronema marinum]
MKVTQNFYYIINYKPLLNYKKEITNLNTIYCKNFFLFFLLLDFLKSNNKNVKLSIRKKNNKSYTFLRAPNKYKKAQVKITNVRYKIKFSFTNNYELSNIDILNTQYFFYFLNYFFYLFLFFESSFFFLEKKSINIKFNSNLLNKLFFEL